MRTLKIKYLEDNRNISEKIMHGFVPHDELKCSALTQCGMFMNSLLYENILDAIDLETGEMISVRELCGAPPLPKPIKTILQRQDRPKGKRRSGQQKVSKSTRQEDSNLFYHKYRNDLIFNHFRNKLIDLFDGRCYACDHPYGLQMDHHVPFAKGGRKEPGNIVMLCYKCNAKKLDYLPEEFYSSSELIYLQSLLNKEHEILSFDFDEERWGNDRIAYLQDIGISPILLDEVKTNDYHEWNILVKPERNISITISVDTSQLLHRNL
ncbi:MAG: HNH endonuclease [Giesbergeria sp.]|uniref:HNH endonuclease n=1 Tax=Giesbergeria sp. TaxID=2818473 RepID=UPI00261717AD|nr:HNH endonuclease [Giesbergeria sp.]MDD2610677.1 HNH endonuclease [Giesbergeria sp.]